MSRSRSVAHLHRDAEAGFGYAQAVRVGRTVYVAGTTALASDLTVRHPNDLGAQLGIIYEDLRRTLESVGLSFRHVVKEVMYTTDMDALIAANATRKSFFDAEHPPASTAVQVERLVMPGLMLEVELIARADLDPLAPVSRKEINT